MHTKSMNHEKKIHKEPLGGNSTEAQRPVTNEYRSSIDAVRRTN